MNTLKIPIDRIVVGERQRTDYGDIDDLADSLERFGLIQPIVLADDNRLIAGGRRLAAAQSLGWTDIPAVYYGQLTQDELMELELEENVRRKEMTWQERVLGIAKIHAMKFSANALAGTKWGYQETGELLGMTKSNVSYALWAASRLKAKDEAVAHCSNLAEVIRIMLQRREDEVLKELAAEVSTDLPTASVIMGTSQTGDAPLLYVQPTVRLRTHSMDAIQLLRLGADRICDHIICDPPYGIDMANLQQNNLGMTVERTADEHDVSENIQLLFNFTPLAFDALPDHGFLVMWCDQEHWNDLVRWGKQAGFRVQRWPLVWIKTDPCQNGAPTFNFTKKTEIAIVMRKPGATLNQIQPTNFYVGSGEDKKLFHHPFAKPRDLWKWIINAVSQPGQLILDPFAGSGTCPVACVETGRVPVANEMVEIHYNELLENLKRAYRALHGPDVRFE